MKRLQSATCVAGGSLRSIHSFAAARTGQRGGKKRARAGMAAARCQPEVGRAATTWPIYPPAPHCLLPGRFGKVCGTSFLTLRSLRRGGPLRFSVATKPAAAEGSAGHWGRLAPPGSGLDRRAGQCGSRLTAALGHGLAACHRGAQPSPSGRCQEVLFGPAAGGR